MRPHGFGGKDRGVLMNRVRVQPALLRWARERSRRSAADLQKRFSRLEAWEQGSTLPTLKQLEAYARATRTPIGYFFLQEPPVESLPVTDFRTVGNADVRRPSPDLLDMLYLCQQRQDWYRDEARTSGEQPLAFVGSLDTSEDTITGAARLRDTLGFDIEQQRKAPTWDQALRQFIRHADASGVLVMVSGVVGSNTHRLLDPKEFRGFALADPFAPLVFINGKDAKAAQIFTLAHEIAHLWLGESGVSNPQVEDADFVADAESTPHRSSENWCNLVAAELLVPANVLCKEFSADTPLPTEANRLARRFKVSVPVVLRRIKDVVGLSHDAYWQAYRQAAKQAQESRRSSGGDSYRNVGARCSKRFARALVASVLEGRTSYTESMRLLDIKNPSTLGTLAQKLGVGA